MKGLSEEGGVGGEGIQIHRAKEMKAHELVDLEQDFSTLSLFCRRGVSHLNHFFKDLFTLGCAGSCCCVLASHCGGFSYGAWALGAAGIGSCGVWDHWQVDS